MNFFKEIDPISSYLMAQSNQGRLLTLVYHSIHCDSAHEHSPWSISFGNFSKQLVLLQNAGWTTISLGDIKKGFQLIPSKSVLITFDDGYLNNYAAFQELVKRKMTASWFVVTKDIGRTSSWHDSDSPMRKMLSNSQLQEMHNAGMSIGSHSHTHRRLTQLTDDEIRVELQQSREKLSNLLSTTVDCLAYPYGDYNKKVISIAREENYRLGLTTHSGFGFANDNLLEIRRVSIMAHDTLSSFARKIAFGANDMGWQHVIEYFCSRLKQRIPRGHQ